MSAEANEGRRRAQRAPAGAASERDEVRIPARWRRLWLRIPDPVEAARPGEGAARVRRIVARYRAERARESEPWWVPAGWRWASAAALVVGLMLGAWTSTHWESQGAGGGEAALSGEEWLEAAWSAAAPVSLAEVYLVELGLDAAEQAAEGEPENAFGDDGRVVR